MSTSMSENLFLFFFIKWLNLCHIFQVNNKSSIITLSYYKYFQVIAFEGSFIVSPVNATAVWFSIFVIFSLYFSPVFPEFSYFLKSSEYRDLHFISSRLYSPLRLLRLFRKNSERLWKRKRMYFLILFYLVYLELI